MVISNPIYHDSKSDLSFALARKRIASASSCYWLFSISGLYPCDKLVNRMIDIAACVIGSICISLDELYFWHF